MNKFTTQQINAIIAASSAIDMPMTEVPDAQYKSTQRADKTVVTGKKGNYQFVLVGEKFSKWNYISSFALKNATAVKRTEIIQKPQAQQRQQRPYRSQRNSAY